MNAKAMFLKQVLLRAGATRLGKPTITVEIAPFNSRHRGRAVAHVDALSDAQVALLRDLAPEVRVDFTDRTVSHGFSIVRH